VDSNLHSRSTPRVRITHRRRTHARLRDAVGDTDHRTSRSLRLGSDPVRDVHEYMVGTMMDRVIMRNAVHISSDDGDEVSPENPLSITDEYRERVKKKKQNPDPYYEQSSKNRVAPTTPDFGTEELIDGDGYHETERMFQSR